MNMVNRTNNDKTTGLTPLAAQILQKELMSRKNLGYSASKTGLASEAIIRAYGKSLTLNQEVV